MARHNATKVLLLTSRTKLTLTVALTLTVTVILTLTQTLTSNLALTRLNPNIYAHKFVGTH